MKIIMKGTCVIILLYIFMLCGCSPKGEVISETKHFKIIRLDDRVIMKVSDDIQKRIDKGSSDACLGYHLPEYPTIDAMRNAIINGSFSESDIEVLALSTPKDKNGNLIFVDPDELYVPVLPGGMQPGKAIFGGHLYSFDLVRGFMIGSIQVGADENDYQHYTKWLNNEAYFGNLHTSIYSHSEPDLERGGTVHYADSKSAYWKIWQTEYEKDGNIIYVLEQYGKNSLSPKEIDVLYTNGEWYMFVTIHNYNKMFYSPPSDEWYLGFGLTPFDPQ